MSRWMTGDHHVEIFDGEFADHVPDDFGEITCDLIRDHVTLAFSDMADDIAAWARQQGVEVRVMTT